MVDFKLTNEQLSMQRMARDFAQKTIKPIAAEYDKKTDPKQCIPMEVIKKGIELGFTTHYIPERYGGGGGSELDVAIVSEEIAAGDVGVATTFGASFLGLKPILDFASEEQKKKWFTRICRDTSHTYLVAFAATEPGSGSDVISEDPEIGIRTTARLDGNDYVLNGTKCFITNGGLARLYTVFAKTDLTKGAMESLSAFIVPADTPGLSIGKIEDKMGQRLSQQSEIILEDVRIPKANIIAGEGQGVPMILKTLASTCAGAGALAVGLARSSFETARDYAYQRLQGGQFIVFHQAIGHKLVNMKMKIEAARCLYLKAFWTNDHIGPKNELAFFTKTFCSDVAMEVTTEAVQVLGGYGYMKEYPVEKLMRDAKLLQIYEGTNEVLRNYCILFLND